MVATLPHRRKLFFLALLLCCWTGTAAAQTQGNGTLYSRFGLGELVSYGSSRAEAMGGGGFALRSFNYTNFSNPASWSDQLLTRAAVGAYYRTLTIRDGSGEAGRLTGASLGSVQFSLPLLSRRLGVGVGLLPYSRTNYRVRSVGELTLGTDSTVTYQIDRAGQGGLQQVVGGFGYRIGDALSVGGAVHFIFGTIEHVRRTSFTGENRGLFLPTTRTDGTRLSGVTGTVGILLSLGGVLAEEDLFSLGAAFTLPTTLDGEYAQTLGATLNRDTLGTAQGRVEVPYKARLGLAYRPDERWTIVADGFYAPWSQFESTFGTAVTGDLPFFGDDLLADRLRASAGVEFIPAGGDLTEPYLRRVASRLGGYFERGYVRVPGLAGANINTLALTGGVSLPTQLFGTHLDINLKVGTRGTANERLVRDVFYGISLNVNFGERWFQRRKLR